MELSTLTSKGQLTIPADLRKEMALHAGDKLNCFIEDDRLIIIPAKGSLKNLKGCVPGPDKPVSTEDMHRAVMEEAARRVRDT